jgi:hypothetical protein
MNAITVAMLGALVVLAALASIQFVRYWRLTKDTFFVWFAVAFATFGVDWGLLIARAAHGADATGLSYLIRLSGFIEIGIAVLLKNRRPP